MHHRELLDNRVAPAWRKTVTLPAGIFVALTGIAPQQAFAQIAARQARVEVVVPKAPIPVAVDTQRVLVYELHITNFAPGPLRLRELDIMDVASPETLLAAYRDTALRAMVAPAGSMTGDSSSRLQPGCRTVAFVWLPIPNTRAVPAALRHRLVFDILDSSSMRSDHGARAAIDSIVVAVQPGAAPVVTAPVRGGQWVAASGPSNSSDHRRSIVAVSGRVWLAQRFAIDWNMVGPNGDTHRGDEHRNESYWGFGQFVQTVAGGQVVAVVDSIPDNAPHSPLPPITLGNIAGNLVTIRIASGQYATYAHLKLGSVRVHMGQHVSSGDVIALLGNSGQTTAPHLHFQITDGPAVFASEGIPYVLRSYTDLGSGQVFEENTHPTIPRRRAIPEENEVVALP